MEAKSNHVRASEDRETGVPITLIYIGKQPYMMFFPSLAFMCLHSAEDMIAYQMVRLISSNLNIQKISLGDLFSLSEISEFTSSEGRGELKEKNETFRSLQKVTFKFK